MDHTYSIPGGGKPRRRKVFKCRSCGNEFASKARRDDHEATSCRNTVTRTKRVEVQRCEAMTNPHLFSPSHRCPYAAVVHLDGEWMCQLHADKWVRGQAPQEAE